MTPEVQKIYQILLEKIIALEIEPGTRLREEALSRSFSLSRTPIRDVLKQLEADGLLEIFSQRGSYVSKIDLDGINAIMYIRASVEFDAMVACSNVLTPGDIEEAKRILALQESLLQEEGKDKKEFANAFFAADNAFHSFLYDKAGKGAVLALLNRTYPYYQRFRFLTGYRDKKESENLYEIHKRMLGDLERKDLAALKEDVLAHNYSGLSGIQSVIHDHPDWFLKQE